MKPQHMKWSIPLTLLSVSIFFVGCGGGSNGPPRASVSGKVTIDGEPVEGVEVNFLNPEFPNYGSFAKTDAEGNYKLVQGAVPGVNTIFFSKVEGGDMALNPDEGIDAGQLEAMSVGNNGGQSSVELPKQIIPEEYTDPSSKLTFPVPDGGTSDANFDL